MITIYNTKFANGNATTADLHVINFDKLCDNIRTSNIDPGVLRVKLFPHSLIGLARLWYENLRTKDLKLWFNLRASFLEKFGECTLEHQKPVLDFKQLEKESISKAWRRFKKKIICNLEHGLRDWMLLNSFYFGLNQHNKRLLDKESDIHFIFNRTYDEFMILDEMLVEYDIYKNIKNAGIMDMYFKEENEIEEEEENIILPTEEKEHNTIIINEEEETHMSANDKQIEEVKMLSEVREPLLDIDKCSLHELIVILEKFSKYPTINVHQAGFGSLYY
jgi:hypothetical protein